MSSRRRLVEVACATLVAASLVGACGPNEPGPPGPEGLQGEMGVAGPPGPQGPAGTTGQDVFETYGTGQLVVTGATTTFVTIPGLTQTINIPAGARVRVDTNGGLQCAGLNNAYAAVDIAIFVDNQAPGQAGMRRVVAANTAAVAQMIANWSFGRTFTLNEGAHVFEVRAINVDTTTAPANVSSGSAPQIQGVLTVTIIKQ